MKNKLDTTARERKAWLAAVRELLRYYEAVVWGEEPGVLERCPLCKVAVCWECLWGKFLGQHCIDYCSEKFSGHPGYLRNAHDVPWARDSIHRLKRWEKRLEEK